jgi:glycosyltransferase involved in cell wall biosynthesis
MAKRTPTNQIDVVIPTHRRPVLLRRALESVLAQSMPPARIWVVSDIGLSDAQAGLQDLPPEWKTLVTPLHSQERGPAGSRNLGLARASSSLIAFLDDDDTWEADFLEVISRALGATPQASFGVGSRTYRPSDARLCIPEGVSARDLLRTNPGFSGSNILYRRANLLRAGGFDVRLRVVEDRDIAFRLLLAGESYVSCDSAVANMDDLRDRPRLTETPTHARSRIAFARKHSGTAFRMGLTEFEDVWLSAADAQKFQSKGSAARLVGRSSWLALDSLARARRRLAKDPPTPPTDGTS